MAEPDFSPTYADVTVKAWQGHQRRGSFKTQIGATCAVVLLEALPTDNLAEISVKLAELEALCNRHAHWTWTATALAGRAPGIDVRVTVSPDEAP